MDYPATQRFVNDDVDDEEEEETDDDIGTPLRAEKKVKVAVLLVDSVTYPVNKGVNKVGRIDSCDVVIDHNTISKEHAEIEAGVGSKSTFISDLGSLNKTKLNDTLLRPGRLYQLQDGDVVRFGSVKAVFKVEENKVEKTFDQSGDFVIPDTPRPIPKESHPIIPGTPDFSFDGSLTDGNRSSEVSVIAGTQRVENTGGRMSPRLSREPSSLRESTRGLLSLNSDKNDTSGISDRNDISELETQKNISVEEDSDEENIFDMVTQQSDIHDNETQRFSKGKVQEIEASRFSVDKTEPYSHSIEDLETQKFPDNYGGVKSRTLSINDLETQKVSFGDVNHGSPRSGDEITSRYDEISDLETQKFSINVPPCSSHRFAEGIESHTESINDLETQKIIDVARDSRHSVDEIQHPSRSSNNIRTQKLNDPAEDHEDSETDEEGIFENSGDDMVDMFDAPTQLIREPREVTPSPCDAIESVSDVEPRENAEGIPREEEMIQHVSGPEENEKQIEDVPGTSECREERVQDAVETETFTEVKISDEKSAKLNDSIESKLNHMFDDVNESMIDEPTQILTQNLEKMLEATQTYESEVQQRRGDIRNTGKADPQVSTSANREEEKIQSPSEEADDIAKSDDEESDESVKGTPEKATALVIQVPEILSTQELFGDLPAFNIFRTPSRASRRGRIKASRSPDAVDTPRPKRSRNSELGGLGATRDTEARKVHTSRKNDRKQSKGSKLAGSMESVEDAEEKPSKSTNNTESKVAESGAPLIEGGKIPSRANGRKKARIQKEVEPEETRAKVEEPMKTESGKELPLKKRPSSMTSDPPSPQKMVAEVSVSTERIATRSNAKTSVETVKKSPRLSVAPSPKRPAPNSMLRVNYNKPESPTPVLPAKTETSNLRKIGTRSRRGDNSSSSVDETLQTQSEPQTTSSPRGNTRRTRKKRLDTSDSVSEEEAAPVKKVKTSTTVLPSSVNARPRYAAQREKRTNGNVSQSSDLEIAQNGSPSTRSSRARPSVNTVSTLGSSLVVGSFDNGNGAHQPSLESQEIQAILGVTDHREKEAPRHRRETRLDSKRDEGFLGFPRRDQAKQDVEEKFEKPVGVPERSKRQPRRAQPDAGEKNEDDNGETGKTRPKPRSKKNADVANQDNLPKGSTAAVVTSESSNVKSNNKSIRNDRIVREKSKTEESPPRVTVAQKIETTTPVRNKRAASRRLQEDHAGKENVVQEPAAKRGRKKAVEVKREKADSTVSSEDEVRVSESSSPLRRGRSIHLSTPKSSTIFSAKTKNKILFTGLNDPHLITIVKNLGGTVTEKPNDCTTLVTDKVRRTYKFLCAMAMAVPIVSVEWLMESNGKGRFLDTGDFLLKDPVEEAKFKFNLRRSLVMATNDKLLDGYTVVVTPNTAPPPLAEMKSIIQACGGKALVRPPTSWPEKSFVVSRQEDAKNVKKFLSKAPKSVRALSVEFILTGILRHELNFEEHKLEID